MSRRLAKRPAGLATFAWYAVLVIPATPGIHPALACGARLGLTVAREPEAFWAAWWTEDPRRAPDVEPDAFGSIAGSHLILGDAVGAAYDALRAAKGARVYDLNVGERLARQAYREGAPRARASTSDQDAVALELFAELGLDPLATTVAQLARAFIKRHPDHAKPAVGSEAVDMARLAAGYSAAKAYARRRVQRELVADAVATVAAGGAAPRKRARKGRAAAPEQGGLEGAGR